MSWWEKKKKVKLLADKEREEINREIEEKKEQEKKEKRKKESSPKQPVGASTPKSTKRRKPSGQGSQTQSQARDNEGSDVEFL